MIEAIDDELAAHVQAFKARERPGADARAATWAGIEARIAEDAAAPPRRRAGPWVAVALAAGVALCIGVAAAVPWRERIARPDAASHQRSDAAVTTPLPGESMTTTRVTPPLERRPASSAETQEPDPASLADMQQSRSLVAPAETQQPGAPVRDPAPRSRRRAPQDHTPSLRPEEVASFRRAQAAQIDGDSEAALRALDAHGRRFPGGLFEEERQVSRAVALCSLGRRAEAIAVRDRFLRERPASHLGERMRNSCREI